MQWLMPNIGVAFSSTIVFGPKALNSRAQANGLGICDAPEIAYGLKGRDTRNHDESGRNLLDDNCLHDNLAPCTKAQSWPFRPQATFGSVPIPRPLAWAVESWPFRPKPKPLDGIELSCVSGFRTHQSSQLNSNTLNAITPESSMSQCNIRPEPF